MKEPQLILRLVEFEGNFKLDLVDLANFEDGSVEQSFDYILSHKEDYVVMTTGTENEEGETLFILAPVELDEDEYCSFLDQLAVNDYLCKEPTGFKYKLNVGMYKDPYEGTLAWWDINNHVIFCFGYDRMMRILGEFDAK